MCQSAERKVPRLLLWTLKQWWLTRRRRPVIADEGKRVRPFLCYCAQMSTKLDTPVPGENNGGAMITWSLERSINGPGIHVLIYSVQIYLYTYMHIHIYQSNTCLWVHVYNDKPLSVWSWLTKLNDINGQLVWPYQSVSLGILTTGIYGLLISALCNKVLKNNW